MITAYEAKNLVIEANKRKELMDNIDTQIRRAAYEGHNDISLLLRLSSTGEIEAIKELLEEVYGYIVNYEITTQPFLSDNMYITNLHISWENNIEI